MITGNCQCESRTW